MMTLLTVLTVLTLLMLSRPDVIRPAAPAAGPGLFPVALLDDTGAGAGGDEPPAATTDTDDDDFTEQDAQAAFDDALDDTPASDTDQGTPEIKHPAPDGAETPETDTGAATPEANTDDAASKPTLETLEKSLADTKAWGHGLATDLAAAKARIAELEKQPVKPAEKPAETPVEDLPQAVQDYLKDYPEAKAALDALLPKAVAEALGGLKPDEITADLARMRGQLNQATFERSVVAGYTGSDGAFVPGHSDAYQVMATPAFKTFMDGKLKTTPAAAQISEPADAIELLNEFKASQAQAAAAGHDAAVSDAGIDAKAMAASTVASGTGTGGKKGKKGEASPEEIFDEAIK